MYEFEIFYLTFFRILSFSTQWRSFTGFPHKTKLFPGISFQNGFSIWNNEVMATNLCYFPANIYLIKVRNGNTKKSCEKMWRHSSVFIVNFEHICCLFLVFPLLTLNK